MPITPKDVAEVAFRTRRFASGYDRDEVDVFLELVEAEMTRLVAEVERLERENRQLRDAS